MGRHKKIPTKNRKKLKLVDPFNKKAAAIKEANLKERNRDPGTVDDQPLPRSLIDLKYRSQLDQATVKRRKKHTNKILEEAERAGIKKGRFEAISQFMRRVDKVTHAFIEEHKLLTSKGLTGRNQADIDGDYALIDEKAKRQKEQKKREVANKIKVSKELRQQAAIRLQEKFKKKEERRKQNAETNLGFAEDSKGNLHVGKAVLDNGEKRDDQMNGIDIHRRAKETAESGKKCGIEKMGNVGRYGHSLKNKPISLSYQDETILNHREVIRFGERYDAPPSFQGGLKKEMDQLMAKAGGKKLLLHSLLKTNSNRSTENSSVEGKKKKFDKVERQQVINAYRALKKKKNE